MRRPEAGAFFLRTRHGERTVSWLTHPRTIVSSKYRPCSSFLSQDIHLERCPDLQRSSMPPRQLLRHQEPSVVSSELVLFPWIAQTHDQQVVATRGSLWLLLLLLLLWPPFRL